MRGYLRPKTLRYVSEPPPPEDLDSATRQSWPGPVTLRLESMSMFVWGQPFVFEERIYILIFAPPDEFFESSKFFSRKRPNDTWLRKEGHDDRGCLIQIFHHSALIFYCINCIIKPESWTQLRSQCPLSTVRPWLSMLHHCSPFFLTLVFFRVTSEVVYH